MRKSQGKYSHIARSLANTIPCRGLYAHPNGKRYRVHTHTFERTHTLTCTRTRAQIAKDEEDLKKYRELLRQREIAREKEEAEHKAKLAAMEAVAQVYSLSLPPPPFPLSERESLQREILLVSLPQTPLSRLPFILA